MSSIADGIDFKSFYEAIVHFDENEEAQDFYYKTMDMPTGKKDSSGYAETVRDRILRVYGMLFCEETGLEQGKQAGVDEVADTADRLYIGGTGFDPGHWYRMKYHFPVIDDDNYDRFAALVIADMHSGPLHDAALIDGDTLVIGEPDPLHMSTEQRRSQKVRQVTLTQGGKP